MSNSAIGRYHYQSRYTPMPEGRLAAPVAPDSLELVRIEQPSVSAYGLI
jgi:hypothetical protein